MNIIMYRLKRRFSLPSQVQKWLILLFVAAAGLRFLLYPIQTTDYQEFFWPWYNFLQVHGGFTALKYSFSNYNLPYLYLLALATYLPLPGLIAIKTISILFDGLLAFFAYRILRLKYSKPSLIPSIGALVLLFAPTIIDNSAAWGQCDAIYTSLCLGCLYFLLKDRPGWACSFLGLAFSFKLQTIFFLPVSLLLLMRKGFQLCYLLLIPAIFLFLLFPAFLVGRPFDSMLTIYLGQMNSGGLGGTGSVLQAGSSSVSSHYPPLTLNAPSFYQWFPVDAPEAWKWLGIILAGLFILFIGFLFWKSKVPLTPGVLLKLTLTFALAIPFLLPEMHERYFYIADVVSIITAFYFARAFYRAIVIQCCSFISYIPFLHTQIVSLAVIAIVVLIITLIATTDLILTLYPVLLKQDPPVKPDPPVLASAIPGVSRSVTVSELDE
ncbi:MAG TPA: hypothetical protein VFN35_00450 [Ktedonobacteraceae bacterium]|nr:hypothetical protein [Ktedonobacteraceae bacterium]